MLEIILPAFEQNGSACDEGGAKSFLFPSNFTFLSMFMSTRLTDDTFHDCFAFDRPPSTTTSHSYHSFRCALIPHPQTKLLSSLATTLLLIINYMEDTRRM